VQLLDVLAQLEALLRHEREVQQEVFRDMEKECKTLCGLLGELGASAQEIEHLLGATV
jgi:hypothetical protein